MNRQGRIIKLRAWPKILDLKEKFYICTDFADILDYKEYMDGRWEMLSHFTASCGRCQ